MALTLALPAENTTVIESDRVVSNHLQELADLAVGETGTVRSVNLEGQLRSYVMRFGIVEGAQVFVVRRVPLGSLRVYRVGQSEIALRPETAKQIMVTGSFE